MINRAALEAAGINYPKGLERFMKNVALYERFLNKFLNDASYVKFKDAMKSGDRAIAEESIHTLKGTSGNLSMEELYKLSDEICKSIRSGIPLEDLKDSEAKLDALYEKICAAIKS